MANERNRPVFDANTDGWCLDEWAHEARILRATQQAIMERMRVNKNAIEDIIEEGGPITAQGENDE